MSSEFYSKHAAPPPGRTYKKLQEGLQIMTNQTGYIVYATDSVGTALGEIEPGAIRLLGEPGSGRVTAIEHIPFGHKFALRALHAGDPVIKYGARIGTATQVIAPGEHVHLHNMRSDFDEARLNAGRRDGPCRRTSSMNCTEEENAMEAKPICQAWLRTDGGKGIRNKVLVLYTVECSNTSQSPSRRIFRRSTGTSMSPARSHVWTIRPSCSACWPTASIRMSAPCSSSATAANISSRTASATSRGPTAARPRRFTCRRSAARRRASRSAAGSSARCWKRSRQAPDAPMYAHELIIGAKCGGSDFTSGIAGNAVIGKFFENLTAAGGTAMMEEVAEAVGLRGHLVSRAVNEDVARDVGLTL